jgi:hypothetical protein
MLPRCDIGKTPAPTTLPLNTALPCAKNNVRCTCNEVCSGIPSKVEVLWCNARHLLSYVRTTIELGMHSKTGILMFVT